MDKLKRGILKNNRVTHDTDIKYLEPQLRESKIFTKDMFEDILAGNADLYDELPTRGPQAFESFIKVLKKSNYTREASILESAAQIGPDESCGAEHTKIYQKETLPRQEIILPSNRKYKNSYEMKSSIRGRCLIINNVDFYEADMIRFGSDRDACKLSTLFRLLDYDVHLKNNLEADDMLKTLKAFSEKDFKSVDSCIVILLSHGGRNNTIFGIDRKTVSLNEIEDIFNNVNCEQLIGKPKVFFIQACRGEMYDSGVPVHGDVTDSVRKVRDITDSAMERQPTVTDMLVAYSTHDGYVSIRDEEKGTWFCDELVETIVKHARYLSLEEMLKRIAESIKYKTSSGGTKQAPGHMVHCWTKEFYFEPIHKLYCSDTGLPYIMPEDLT